MQCWRYGEAMARERQQRPRRGLIMMNGESAGLVQLLEVGLLKNTVHGVMLDCGPLWFDGFGTPEDFSAFMKLFRKEFPKRLGRKIRIIPNVPDLQAYTDILENSGFTQSSKGSSDTIWLDLRPSLDDLRKNLYSGWRQSLLKAEKKSINIIHDYKGQYVSWLLREYEKDKTIKGYSGVTQKTLLALARHFLSGENMLISVAQVDNRPIAAIVVFIHGFSATYQIGFTSAAGRELCAHHLLLWDVLTVLKERSVYDFDLGGFNEGSAQGVKAFKQAMGGEVVKTAGLYI